MTAEGIRFAAIDVGSNALRLRIVEADGTAKAHREVTSLRAPVRLGREVFVTGRLSPAALGDACRALRSFREAMDAEGVVAYRATATSAVRESANAATLIERARREAGVDLEVIEGIEEARLVQLAVSRATIAEGKQLLIDVGGGSTELTVVEGRRTVFATSLPLGTVRLLETYLAGATSLSKKAHRLMCEGIDRALAEALPHLKKHGPMTLVGTGGNIDTLAELCPAAPPSKPETSRRADVQEIRDLLGKLAAMTPAARERGYGLRPDRADTIVPAAAIFVRIADAFKAVTITAPGVGVKDGILTELVDRHFRVWDSAGQEVGVIDACRRLGQRYQWDEAHAERVAFLSGRLFDDLDAVHQLSARDRLLLVAASLLHDVGDFVRYDGHHKHSYYLILNSDLIGLSPTERAIVANVARYHRKSAPDTAHANFRELDKDSRAKVRALSAILRIADALDREHRAKVKDVHAALSKGRVVLRLEGADERELEEWTVAAKASLFQDVFALDVVIASADEKPEKGDKGEKGERRRDSSGRLPAAPAV